jgi:DNA-binding CsgD family transcriptional regulator
MRQPPPIVRALLETVFSRADARLCWWDSLRALAETSKGSRADLIERSRSAVARSELCRARHMFESLEESLAHVFAESSPPPVLSVRVEGDALVGRRIMVALRADVRGSVRAMAALQGALVAVLSVLSAEVSAKRLSARGFELAMGLRASTFRARLAARGLGEDVVALGLDPDKLGCLVEGVHTDAPPKLTLRLLETRFSLTPTQGRVALRLASGSSLREASESLKMTYGTARTHLKQIFAKLEVRTQSGLVAKLLGVKP